jgi:poly-gamma-glutamate capsule biosynthesis protein CapA/YwtB (metallophosphatase superfamily)
MFVAEEAARVRVIAASGLLGIIVLMSMVRPRPVATPDPVVHLLALGDVNLGRETGQEILKGDTLYPFAFVRDTLAAFDLVFANLECTLSDQDGETQSPKNNLIFTGPPAGALTLKQSGISIVSTANNHALDYGIGANRETAQYLSAAGVAFVGTSGGERPLYEPVRVTVKGIRFAFFACTDVMNITDPIWRKFVAAADSAELLPRIRTIRDSVDFIVISYHGGEEYAEKPTQRTMEFAHAVIAAGAALFVGHHPHVAHGIEEMGTGVIVYSLGNFAFHQPQRYWTQRSFGFAADIEKDQSGAHMRSYRCLPLLADWQPRFLPDGEEASAILDRVYLSTESIGKHAW